MDEINRTQNKTSIRPSPTKIASFLVKTKQDRNRIYNEVMQTFYNNKKKEKRTLVCDEANEKSVEWVMKGYAMKKEQQRQGLNHLFIGKQLKR